jgi:hypothetical protein
MSLAGLFAATAAMVGAATMVGAVRHRLAVRRRRRERERRRQPRPRVRLNRTATLSPPLRVLVSDARVLAELLEHTRRIGDDAWARATVAYQRSGPSGLSPHASYVAALGDALRATSGFLVHLHELPSAEAEILEDRGVITQALRRLVTERATPAHYAEGGDGLLSSTVPEAIDEMERRLDAAIGALEHLVAALTTDRRRPYR